MDPRGSLSMPLFLDDWIRLTRSTHSTVVPMFTNLALCSSSDFSYRRVSRRNYEIIYLSCEIFVFVAL